VADSAENNVDTYSGVRPAAGSSLDLDDQQFASWTELLERRLGLFIAPERRSFLASGIRTRMREIGCDSSQKYYEQLTAGDGQAREWSLLTDRLTVHETCFFRHESSMRLVKDKLLPDAFAQGQSFLAWSVGCSTGEETYSLAMMIDAVASGSSDKCHFGVTGTDISLPSLNHAREGIYLHRRLKDIPDDYRQAYCKTVSEKRFQVSDHLRRRVCFSQLNLRDLEAAPLRKVNLIYCQNLLIYYSRERREQIVDGLTGFLRPAGVLIVGPGELLDWRHPNMERVRYDDTLAYQRID
jgi:chemotaxis protein methyltransferase CheR/type IV pilus assembly protein PilK